MSEPMNDDRVGIEISVPEGTPPVSIRVMRGGRVVHVFEESAQAEESSEQRAWPFAFYDSHTTAARLQTLATLFEQTVEDKLTGRVSVSAPERAAADIRSVLAALRQISGTGQSIEPDHWKFRCMARELAGAAFDRDDAPAEARECCMAPECCVEGYCLYQQRNCAGAEAEARSEQADDPASTARRLLEELTAVVRGECPSLLDGDRGGYGALSIQIDAALEQSR